MTRSEEEIQASSIHINQDRGVYTTLEPISENKRNI